MSLKTQKNSEQVGLDFGFKAEYDKTEGEFKTISGKDPKQLTNATKYTIHDFDYGNIITGYPELTIFNNNEKDEHGNYKRKSQSVRCRIIDSEDEYIDLYANIPRRDKDGFIKDLTKYFDFYRTGFDLVFSFMRYLDEANVVDSKGEEINRINMVNIEKVCEAIDRMAWVKVKIVESNDEEYPSFILLDMREEL